jgi:hypothetical protein
LSEHSVITDPNIHEPKGVAAASAGQVYVANGSGSGAWTAQQVAAQATHSGKTLTTNGTTTSWTADNRVLARGTVNVSGSSVSNAVNVASVSGSSVVTVTFTNALSDANYVVIATLSATNTNNDSVIICSAKGTTTVTFRTYRGETGAAISVNSFDFVIFG